MAGKRKKRAVGETYRPEVQVLTIRDGRPTRIQLGDDQFFKIDQHQDRRDYFNNAKGRRKQRRAQEREKGRLNG